MSYQWYQGTAPSTTTPVGTNSPNYTTVALTTTTSYWVRVSEGVATTDSTTAVVSIPTIVISNLSSGPPLTLGNVLEGNAGTAETYRVDATNLTNNITVSAAGVPGTEVSITSAVAGFASSVIISMGAGTVTNQTVWVRIAASATVGDSPTNGNITNSSTDAATQTVAVTGTVVPVPDIVLTAADPLGLGFAAQGNPGAEFSFTVSGTNLQGNISMTAPANTEISETPGAGYTNAINLVPGSGTVTTTTIYIRIAAAATGVVGTPMAITSPNAVTENVNLTGAALTAPTINTQPQSQQVNSGASANLSVTATSTNTPANMLHYEWFQGATPATGTPVGTDSPTFNTPNLTATTQYCVRVTEGGVVQTDSTTATVSVAVINTSETVRALGTTAVGVPSAPLSYTVSGTDLTGDITINAPAGVEISDAGAGGPYFASRVVTEAVAESTGQVIHVRLTAAAVASINVNLTHDAAGAAQKLVNVTGSVVQPVLVAVPTTRAFGNVAVGAPTGGMTYDLSGTDIFANVIVTAPSGVEVSDNGTNWQTGLNLTPAQVNGTGIQLHVRLTAAAVASINANITHVTTGDSENVLVTGNVVQPVLATAPGTLNFGTRAVGVAGASVQYNLSGTDIVGDITVTTSDPQVTVSRTGAVFTPSVIVTAAEAMGVGGFDVFVRVIGTAPAALSETVINTTAGDVDNVTVNATIVQPALLLVPTSRAFGTVAVGLPTAGQTYQLSGTNVLTDVVVTAPAGVQVSTDGSTWLSGFNVAPGLVNGAGVQLHVRLTAAAVASINDVVTHVTDGDAQNLTVTGSVVQPVLNTTETSLPFGSMPVGFPSQVLTYVLSGTDLVALVDIAAPLGAEISTDGGSSWGTTRQVAAAVAMTSPFQEVRVRIITAAVGSVNANITHDSTGAVTKNVLVQAAIVQPTLTPAPLSLTFGNRVQGVASAALAYAVQGTNLFADVNVSFGADLEYSTTGAGGPFGSTPLVVPASGGASVNQPVHVRIAASAPLGALNRVITHSNAHLAPVNVTVTATMVAEPVITVTPGTLNLADAIVNTPGAPSFYTLDGTDLQGDIIVSAPAGFEVSINGAAGAYAASHNVPHVGGVVSAQQVHVRVAASPTLGVVSGNVTNASSLAQTKNVAVDGEVVPMPVISISGVTPPLDLGSAAFGVAGTPASYMVGGSNLQADIVITAPTDTEVCETIGGTYTPGLNLTPVSGTVAATQIFARIKATAATGAVGGNITHTSTSATPQNLSVTGNVGAQPDIVVSQTSRNLGTTTAGTAGATQMYEVSGTNLQADIVLGGLPAGVEMSKDGSAWSTTTLNVSPTEAISPGQTIHVRIAAGATAAQSPIIGNISHTSTNAAPENVSLSGTILPKPDIVVSTNGPLNLGTTTAGTAGTLTPSFDVSGTNLQDDIVITAPARTEVSLTAGSGYAPSINLPFGSGTVNATTIFVRIAASAGAGAVGSPLANTSLNADTENVTLTGTVLAQPDIVVVAANPVVLGTITAGTATPGTEFSFTVGGTNLQADISMLAPARTEISLASGTGYTNSIDLPFGSGTVNTTTIFIRIAANAAAGAVGTPLQVTSLNAVTENVNLSGTVLVQPDIIVVAANPITLGTTTAGTATPGAEFSFTVEGTNLQGDINISAPARTELSLTPGAGYGPSINLPFGAGTVPVTTIYIRIAASASGGLVGTPLQVTSLNAVTENVNLTGNVLAQPDITVVAADPIMLGTVAEGTAGTEMTFTVEGTNLQADIQLNATARTELSLTSGSGYAGSVNVPFGSGTVAPTTVYVRIAASALAGAVGTPLQATSLNAVTENINLTGTVLSAPQITVQPQSQSVATGTGANLFVTANSTNTPPGALSYQWYEGAAPSTTTPVGTGLATFDTPNLTVTTQYWVRVSEAGGVVVTDSATATITVLTAPQITAQPQSQDIATNGTANLSVTANSTNTPPGTLTYQWYEGAAPLTTTPVGSNSPNFTTPNLTTTTQYWVRVSEAGLVSTDSATATITVVPPPSINTQPLSQDVASGANFNLSVAATSNRVPASPTLTYQWYSGGSPTTGSLLSGETNATLSVPAGITATTQYSVRVTDGPVFTDSSVATVTVVPVPTINTQPLSQDVIASMPFNLSVTATSNRVPASPTLTYQWYSGGSPTTTGVAISGETNSTLSVPGGITATTQYSVRVTDGPVFTDSNVATVTVVPAPTINTQPLSQDVASGANFNLSVAATSNRVPPTSPLVYQWYIGGSPTTGLAISGETNSTLSVPGGITTTTDYSVRVTDGPIFTDSSVATVTVVPVPTINTQPLSQNVASGVGFNLSVAATSNRVPASPTLTYQWYSGGSPTTTGVAISGETNSTLSVPGGITATTDYAVRVTDGPVFTDSNVATVTVVPVPTINTQPLSQDVASGVSFNLSVTATSNRVPPSATLTYQWYSGGSPTTTGVAISGETNSTLSVPGGIATTTDYSVRVTDGPVFTDSNVATVTVVPVPTINTQPLSQDVASGANFNLSVAATSNRVPASPTLTYQWYSGGSPTTTGVAISGETNSTLSVPAGITTTTQYSVRVTDGPVFTDSSVATVTVVPVPTINTQPQSQNVIASTGFNLSVTATSNRVPASPTLTYQWYSGGSPTTGSQLSGETNATLFVPGGITATTDYSVRVTDGPVFTDSNVATVTVVPAPTINTQPLSQDVASGVGFNLSVVATSNRVPPTSPLVYQWYSGGSPTSGLAISGETNSTLSVPGGITTTTQYSVRVTDGPIFTDSNTVTVTVVPPPSISTQPLSQNVPLGSAANLVVVASSNRVPASPTLTYAWFVGTAPNAGTPAVGPGSNSDTFMPSPTVNTDYWVRVTDGPVFTDSASATVTVLVPDINVSPNTLPLGSVQAGFASTPQPYTLTGTNLQGNVTVTPPAGCEVALGAGTFQITPLAVVPSSGSVNVVINVRIASNAGAGPIIGNVTNTSANAAPENVSVTGQVVLVNVSQNSFGFGVTPQGVPTASQQYTLTGQNLPGNIDVTAPAGIELSKTGSAPWSGTLVVTPGEAGPGQPIHARLSAAAAGPVVGDITNVSGVAFRNVSVTGQVVALNSSETALDFGFTNQGTASAVDSFLLTGANLQGNVTVTPPAGVELSRDGGSNWLPTINVLPGDVLGAGLTIQARIAAATLAGPITGNVSAAGGGAATINMPVTGRVVHLVVSTPTLPLGNNTQGVAGTPNSYTLTGAGLIADVTVTAPAGTEVSLTAGSGYQPGILVPRDVNDAVNATIFVRTTAAAPAAAVTGNVTNVSLPATQRNVALSGQVIALASSAPSLNLGTVLQGTASGAQSYQLTGANLQGNVDITAPAGCEVAIGAGSYATGQVVVPTGGMVNETINVRISAGATAAPITGSVTNVSTGVATVNVAVSGQVRSLGVSTPTLVLPTATNPAAGGTQVFTVTGANLSANVSVTAPTNVQVSSTGTGGPWQTTLNLSPTAGALTAPVHVRIAPGTGAGPVSGNIDCAYSGLPTQSVSVTGQVVSLVSTKASLNLGIVHGGLAGTPDSYVLTGTNLLSNVTVNAPTNCEVAVGAVPGPWAPSQVLTVTGGALSATMHVRIAATAPVGSISGNVQHTSTDMTTLNISVSGNVVSLAATGGPLNLGTVQSGTAGGGVAFTVTGSNLQGNVLVTPPTNCEVSITGAGGAYALTQSIIPSAGSVNQQVFVRVAATAPTGTLSGNVACSSNGATTQNVAVSAQVVNMGVAPASLILGTSNQGVAGTPQPYTLTGTNLQTGVTVTAPTGCEISITGAAGTYQLSHNVTPAAAAAGQVVHVRIAATAAIGAVSGNVTNVNTSGPATPRNVSITGNVVQLQVSTPGPIGLGTTNVGVPGTASSYTLTGSNLQADAVVTAPGGCEVSITSATSGFAPSQNVTAVQAAGGVTVFVRLTGAAVGSVSGNVTNTSAGATQRDVSVNGNVVNMTTSVSTLPLGFAALGAAGTPASYTLTGFNLQGNVTITASSGIQVSIGGAGGSYAGVQQLTPAQVSGPGFVVFVRIAASAPVGALVAASLTHSSTGATNRVVSVTGEVVAPPVINTQPQNVTIGAGSTTMLSVAATGLSLSYQWYQGTAPSTTTPVGTNASTFTTPALVSTTDYWVRVTAAGVAITNSATATVTVVQAPVINTQPASQSIVNGNPANLSVSATGTSLTYQWHIGTPPTTNPVSGATNATFAPSPTITTSYWVRVTAAGVISTNSTAATVTVINPPVITQQPQVTQNVIQNGQASLAVSVTGTSPFTFQWHAGASGNIAPIAGATSSSFQPTMPSLGTHLFWVRVENSAGAAFGVNSNTATVVVSNVPVITTQPVGSTIVAGQPATLTVVATGSAPLNYQWYQGPSGTTTTPGVGPGANTATFNPSPLVDTNYWVRVSNTAGQADSVSVTVTVQQPPTIAVQPTPATITAGLTATMSVIVQGTAPFTYQWYQGLTGDTSTPVAGATSDTLVTPPLFAGASFWVRVSNVTGAANAADSNDAAVTVNASTAPSFTPGAAITAARTQVRDNVAVGTVADIDQPAGDLVVVATIVPADFTVSNIVNTLGDITASIVAGQAAVLGAHTITFEVRDAANLTAQAVLDVTVTVNTAPTITLLTDVTVPRNTSAGPLAFTISDLEQDAATLTLSVTMDNAVLVDPVAGVAFGGTDENRDLTLTPRDDHVGLTRVTVIVTDAGGLFASTMFVLTVGDAASELWIAAIPDQVIASDFVSGPIPISVLNLGVATTNMPTGQSSAPTVIDNFGLNFAGTAPSFNVRIIPEPGATGASRITVSFSDGATTASRTFVVTVQVGGAPPPDSGSSDDGCVAAAPAGLGWAVFALLPALALRRRRR